MQKLLNNTFAKFLGVGVINTIVGTAIMFISYNVIGLSYWISSALNYIVGGIISFFLNKNFTFKYGGKSGKAFIKFAINVTLCYLIAYGLAKPLVIQILTDQSVKIQENVAMITGMGLYVMLNYFGQKFFAFRDNSCSDKNHKEE